jgi:membrane-bound serine protease (ClpP class)
VRTLRVFLATAAALVTVLALAGPVAAAESPRVLALELANDVNPVTADFVIDGIDRAEREGYDAVVILLDTPGGLAESMREIVQRELASSVPVVVYVSPDGARAASAGVWIGQAADVLAMAPQTNIGSSTPIQLGGEDIQKDLRRKVVNDAAASLRSLAATHGRNAEWADRAVRQASNLTAQEALDQNVIDVVAPTLAALLDDIDGTRTVPKGIVLETAGAQVTTVEMSLWDRILDTIIDPNIVVLLMSLGVLAITVEIFNPGLVFPAAFGAVSLIVGLFGLQVLPFSWAGVLLLLVALGFFAAELFVTSHGALAVAGAVSFVFGALILFNPAGDAYQVSIPVAIALGAVLALFAGFAVAKGLAARRAPPRAGREEIVGQVGVVRRWLDPEGLVFVHGELWRARTASGESVPVGSLVRVVRIEEGLVLEVDPVDQSAGLAEASPIEDPGKVTA